MDHRLKQAKQTIRAFIQANPTIWTEAKLAEVIAFAQEMGYLENCCCLHPGNRYDSARGLPLATNAEAAYYALGVRNGTANRLLRNRRLIPILKVQLRLRMRTRPYELGGFSEHDANPLLERVEAL